MDTRIRRLYNRILAHERRLLLLLLLVFLAVGLAYDVSTPIYEKPDESYHFFFAVELARGNGIPVQDKTSGQQPWRQEASQPPLYYMLAGALISPLPLDDAEATLWRNPHQTIGYPTVVGNKNVYIHPPGSTFDSPVEWAVHLARWLSLLLGAITVWATWKLGRELAPEQPAIAWGAAGLVAFTPQFLFISTAVSNDATVTAAATVGLWLLVRAVRRGLRPVEAGVLALACAVAALSKLNGIVFVGLAVAVLLVLAWRNREEGGERTTVSPLRAAGLVVAAVTVLAGWWYWRNWVLYGDPTGLSMMLAVDGQRGRLPSLSTLKWEFEGLRISFWAVFGWFNVLADDIVYTILDIVLVIGAAGLFWRAVRWTYEQRSHGIDWKTLGVWTLVVLWPILVFVGLVRWTLVTMGSQGRLLFPAIAAIAVLLVVGLLTWIPRRLAPVTLVAAGIIWMTWSASLPVRVIAPAYAEPRHGPEIALPANATKLDYRYGDIRLLGYELQPARVARSQQFELTLYWQAMEDIETSYSIGIKVFGIDKQLIAREDSYPGYGAYPTTFWQPGEIIVDRYRIWISGRANVPVWGDVWVDVYERDTFQALPVQTSNGEQLGVPSIGHLKVAPPPGTIEPAPVTFADGVAFGDVSMSSPTIRAGDPMTVTLEWRPYAAPSTDYTVFMHLVPANEITEPLIQVDRRPRDGHYPTHIWQPGERIPDSYALELPAVDAAGDYELLVGLYQLESLQRLSVADGAGDYVRLATLTYDGQQWQAALHPLPEQAMQKDVD